jgi:hypothetical protein
MNGLFALALLVLAANVAAFRPVAQVKGKIIDGSQAKW